jgi:6-pyruvoyl-tetrahydropterin synthase
VVVAGEVDQASGCVLDLRLLSDVISRRVIRDVDHRDLKHRRPWLGPELYGQLVSTERLHLEVVGWRPLP